MPPLTDEARRRPLPPQAGSPDRIADSYETRTLGERCITWGNDGPPMMPPGYNANLDILQGPGYVVVRNEMVHAARLIPIDGARPHVGGKIRKWSGDSRGHWEGNTLVVETTNFNDKIEFRNSTRALHVVERFTRVDADTIDYRFTVDDPNTWTRPWTAAHAAAQSAGTDLRIRVPRRQLRTPEHPARPARRRSEERALGDQRLSEHAFPLNPAMPMRRRLFFAGAAVALSFCLALAVLLALDVYVHARYEKGVLVNVWGYRGPTAGRKQPGEYRIAVLGGSTAFGYGVTWNESMPAILESRLAQVPGRFRVVNLAYNNEGAYSFTFTLKDYWYLKYDLVCLYRGLQRSRRGLQRESIGLQA